MLIALVVLAGAAWWQRDSALLRGLTPRAEASMPRKCRKGGETLYTNGVCPPGTTEAAVEGGAITVVPGQRLPVLPALPGAGASRQTVRDLLAPADGADLRDRQIEQAIGR